MHVTKPEIVPGDPEGEFADIKSIEKETTDTQKRIFREAKTNMTEKDRPKMTAKKERAERTTRKARFKLKDMRKQVV